MTETLGANPILPKESAGSKEIPLPHLVKGILSVPTETKRVQATRIALRYLLEDGRMVDSVELFREIHLEKLPFVDGERNNMLKSILTVAKNKCREDPSDAYAATESIRFMIENREKVGTWQILAQEEYKKFDREALTDTSAIVTGRLIECLLDPNLPRGRYEEALNRLSVGGIVREADQRGYFDRIYNSLQPDVQQELNPFIPDDIKKKLGIISTTGSAEKVAEEIIPEEIGEISDFKDEWLEWQHRDHKIKIRKMDNYEMWMIFFNVANEKFGDNRWGLLSDNFDLASAIKDFQDIEPDTADKIYQALAKSFLSGLKEKEINPVFLNLLKEMPYRISLDDPNSKKVFLVDKDKSPPSPFRYSYYSNREYTQMVTPTTLTEDDIKNLDPNIVRSLNVEIGKALLETWIKGEKAGENAVNPAIDTADQAIPSAENIINMEGIFPDDLPKKLNELLSQNQDKSHIKFSFSPDQLKEYIASVAEGFDIKGGNIIVDKGENLIVISGLRITNKSGVGVTLDLVLSNDKDGIRADITKFHRDFLARVNKASSLEEVERQMKAINPTIKKRLDEETSKDNSVWKTKKVSILDGKVRVEFEKALLFAP